MLSATFPVELGMLRLRNLIADCSSVVGPNAIGAATAAWVQSASNGRLTWAKIAAITTQPQRALLSSLAIVSNPTSASCAITEYTAIDTRSSSTTVFTETRRIAAI